MTNLLMKQKGNCSTKGNKGLMQRTVKNVYSICDGVLMYAQKCETWPEVKIPWFQLHIDFADPVNGYYYLIVGDSYTKLPEVARCKRSTSCTVINFLHELFARFGVPDIIVFDNGTQFVSWEFKGFCEMFTLEHKTIATVSP
ncbi:uncharacterized protein K02A2.6-like [Octopus sinensis]|uniref:Uncharacterized protein K02A2.6-like n=1 Tax=Octopus sinensis TaxID=2607531 RepID=A0A6P7SSX8_9MOLL|nr:uncharacterized protein K02A2.6-like [Octopus sinensis]